MDLSQEMDRLLDAAIAGGILEDVDGDLRATRAWKRELQVASLQLTREAADCPTCPRPPDPLAECVRRALPNFHVKVDVAEVEALASLLTQFEVANMTPAKRVQNGYPAEWPPTNAV